MDENDYEEPGAERAGEQSHREDSGRNQKQVPRELCECGKPAHWSRQRFVVLEAKNELLISEAAVVAGQCVAHRKQGRNYADELLKL